MTWTSLYPTSICLTVVLCWGPGLHSLHPSCFTLPLHGKQTVFLSLIKNTDTISTIIILEQNPAVTLTLSNTDLNRHNPLKSLYVTIRA